MGDIYKIRELGLLEKGMDMRIARQAAITANIANSSTPGYKAVKVKFENRLQAAMGQKFGMTETHPRHLPNKMKGPLGVNPVFTRSHDKTRLDGNNVDLDKEFIESATNSTSYEALIAVTNKHLQTLFSVFQGGGAAGGR